MSVIAGMIIAPTPPSIASQYPAFAYSVVKKASKTAKRLSKTIKSSLRITQARKPKEKFADRAARVSSIRITPYKFVGYEDQNQIFNAFPTDSSGRTIQGVRYTWESSDPDKVKTDNTGRATFLKPGLARITCRAGSASASIYVLVKSGKRPSQTDDEWLTDQRSIDSHISSATDENRPPTTIEDSLAKAPDQPKFSVVPALMAGLFNPLSPSGPSSPFGLHALGQNNGSCTISDSNDVGYDELWSEPRNLIGSPRNRAMEKTAIGSVLPEGSNFNFGVPIVSLGGRGIGANLTLYYNSRVWTRRQNTGKMGVRKWGSNLESRRLK